MCNYKILILDDENTWLTNLESIVSKAGFAALVTHSAEEAINLGCRTKSIKFALIDEILYELPIPRDENERELQMPQGHGVIGEIRKHRHDIQFIIVTSAPYLRAKESKYNIDTFDKETAKLRQIPGVIDVLHKRRIDEYADTNERNLTYQWLYKLLKKPIFGSGTDQNKKATGKITIRLGFTDKAFEKMLEMQGRCNTNYVSILPFLKKGNPQKIIQSFFESSKEQSIFLEPYEAKERKEHKQLKIKSNSQHFQILKILAIKSVIEEPVTIHHTEYKFESRSKPNQDIDVDTDNLANQDFAYEYGDGGKKLAHGIQIEKRDNADPEKKAIAALKGQIHFLKKILANADVAPEEALFIPEQGGYAPKFELDITLYKMKQPKKSSRAMAANAKT